MEKNKWYNPQKLLSHNALFNVVLSMRGGGKTYAFTKHIIKSYLKNGSQSAYIRRNKCELDDVKPTFFKAIEGEFPNHKFNVKGDVGYIDDKPFVHFIALSTSSNKKSKAYPTVDFALFDEYIITNNGYKKYLKNEMILLFDLCETIFRCRDNWRIVFLSNSVSYVCPLFDEMGIKINSDKEFQKFHNGLFLLQIYKNDEFTEDKKNTRFAKLIQNSKYYKYAIENELLEDNNEYICDRVGQLTFMFSIRAYDFEVGVWLNHEGMFYIDEKIEPNTKNKYFIYNDDMKEGYINIRNNNNKYTIKKLKDEYLNGCVYYSTQRVKKFFINNIIKNI